MTRSDARAWRERLLVHVVDPKNAARTLTPVEWGRLVGLTDAVTRPELAEDVVVLLVRGLVVECKLEPVPGQPASEEWRYRPVPAPARG